MNERTAIWSRYRLTFLATSCASLLRIIGRRFLVQFNTWIFRAMVSTRQRNLASGRTWHGPLLAGYPGNFGWGQRERSDGEPQ